jgi:hypothetical protein
MNWEQSRPIRGICLEGLKDTMGRERGREGEGNLGSRSLHQDSNQRPSKYQE